MEKNRIESYIKTYDSQTVKYFIVTFLGLSFLFIGIPTIALIAVEDIVPNLKDNIWIEISLIILFLTECIFFTSIIIIYLLKEKRKLFSLMMFDFIQWLLLTILFSAMYFSIILFVKDYFVKIFLTMPYLIGIVKIIFDKNKKIYREKQVDIIMGFVTKYGGLLYLLIVIIRWCIGFISPKTEKVSLIGVLSPILIVTALVFYTEYQWERILF